MGGDLYDYRIVILRLYAWVRRILTVFCVLWHDGYSILRVRQQ